MKHVFRLGYILIPMAFLISQTAYSAPKHPATRHARSPASVELKKIQISDLSPLESVTQVQSTHQVHMASDMRPVTPPIGRGMGVEAPIFRFR